MRVSSDQNMFPIVEITSKYEVEQLGTKEKFWIYDQEKKLKKLFKVGRENTGENWAEKITSEIAELIGLPHAEYAFAQYNGKLGTLSDSFVPNDARLIHGNELLAKIDNSYPTGQFYKVRAYKLETVLSLVELIEKKYDIRGSLHQFIGYIVFDCFVANQDRHHENWGYLINKKKKIILAPTYDHAAGLGCKVSNTEAKERFATRDKNYTLEAFCSKAKTPFYTSDNKKINSLDACSVAAKFDKDALCYWIDQITMIDPKEIQTIFEKVPQEFIESESIEFAMKMLEINSKRLNELKQEVCK